MIWLALLGGLLVGFWIGRWVSARVLVRWLDEQNLEIACYGSERWVGWKDSPFRHTWEEVFEEGE